MVNVKIVEEVSHAEEGTERRPFPTAHAWAWIYIALLGVLCAALAWEPLESGDDFWAHAAVGRWIAQHGQVPHQTLFLWPAEPTPWIAHSWFTQLTFYGMMAMGGENGGPVLALIFTAIVIACIYILLWRLWSVHSPVTFLTALLFGLTILRGHIRYNPRPEIVSGLFLAVLFVVLAQWSRTAAPPSRRDLLQTAGSLSLMFIAWANFHGGVVLGLIIVAATAVADAVQDRFSSRSRALLGIAVLCCAVVAINPYGFGYWKALVLVGGPVLERIEEWKPLWAEPYVSEKTIAIQVVLALIAGAAWRLNPERRKAHLVWLVLLAISYGFARRNGWLLGLASLAVMAANASQLAPARLFSLIFPNAAWRYVDESGNLAVPMLWRHLARVGTAALLVAAILFGAPPRPVPFPQAVSPQLGRGLADTIKTSYPTSKIYNDYATSSYLQWRLAGKPPLFIDLLNAYDIKLCDNYDEILGATDRGLQLLDDLKVDVVVLGWEAGPTDIQMHLDRDARWRRVYDKPDGVIWERK